jgi:hypothetical protein
MLSDQMINNPIVVIDSVEEKDLIGPLRALGADAKELEAKNRPKALASLKQLRDGFLSVWVSLFYKYRLVWQKDPDGTYVFDTRKFLDHSKVDYQAFLGSMIIRTDLCQYFINVRAGMLSQQLKGSCYLFDAMVQHRIRSKCKQFDEQLKARETGQLLVAKGTSGFKKRFIVCESDKLQVLSSKKSSKPIMTLSLVPGSFHVLIPIVERDDLTMSFSLVPILREDEDKKEAKDPKAKKQKKTDANEPLHFRCPNDDIRKRWVRVIRARVLEATLRLRYSSYGS